MVKKNLLLNGMALLMCLFLFAGVSAQTGEKQLVMPLITSDNPSWTFPTTVDGVPIKVTRIAFSGWGGGGAGGYAYSTNSLIRVTGGGGGAAYALTNVYNPEPGETFNIVIGQGGHATGDYTTTPDIADGGNTTVTRNSTSQLVLMAMGGKTVTGYMNLEGAAGGDAYQCVGQAAFSGGKGADACAGLAGAWSTSGGGGGAGSANHIGGAGGEKINDFSDSYCLSYNVEVGGKGGAGNPGSGDGGAGKKIRILIGDGWGNLQGDNGANYGGGGGGSASAQISAGDANGGEGAPGVVKATIYYTTENVEIADGETTTCSGAEFDVALDITPTAFTVDQLASSNFVIENVSVTGLSIGGGTVTYNTTDGQWHLTGTVTNQTSEPLSCNYTVIVNSPNNVVSDTATIHVNVYGKLDGGLIEDDQFVCQDQEIQVIYGDGTPVGSRNTAEASGGSGSGTYQWYVYDIDHPAGYNPISGANAANYTPIEEGAFYFRRDYVDATCGTVYAKDNGGWGYLYLVTVNPVNLSLTGASEDTICSNSNYYHMISYNASSPAWNVYNADSYYQKSTDKGSTWEDVHFVAGGPYSYYDINLTPADFSAGDDIWYRVAIKFGDCDSIPSNGIHKLHIKEIPDYTDQFEDLEITLWYGACDTAIAVPELTPTPASITRADNYGDRLVPGEYELKWNVIADNCNIPVEYTQNVTVEFPECGTLEEPKTAFDADGKEYQTIRIGCDCWFAENLRTNAPDAAYYDDDDANEAFGKLYTWADAVGVNNEEHSTMLGTTFIQGICPEGWAIPSVAQYNTMLAKAGGAQAIMSDEESAWLPGYAGTNASGFGAMGAGYYESLQYQRQLGYTYFWTSDLNVNNSNVAKVMELRCGCDEFTCKEKSKEDKVSVRCVRVSEGEPEGGSEETFTCGTSKMKDADGNEYETVLIGTQCWTKTNLRVVPAGATDGTASGNMSETDPYYYVNSSVDASVYGYYYNWEAAKLACPSGWHLPSDAEWDELESYVRNQSEYVCGSSSSSIAKALASETGWNTNSGECTPGDQTTYINNATGFSAVPAGFKWYLSGIYDMGKRAVFATSDLDTVCDPSVTTNQQNCTVWYDETDVWSAGCYNLKYALSVRCLKDAE